MTTVEQQITEMLATKPQLCNADAVIIQYASDEIAKAIVTCMLDIGLTINDVFGDNKENKISTAA